MFADVILSGGEAGGKDLTAGEALEVVDGNAYGACSVEDPCDCIAALLTSYGPSEGLRPPQDDTANGGALS